MDSSITPVLKHPCESCSVPHILSYHEGVKKWLCTGCWESICPTCQEQEMTSFEKNSVGQCAYCNYGSAGEEH